MVNTTLQISSLNRPLRPVCSDQWSEEWSSQTCKQLGYLGPAQTDTKYDFNLVDSDFWYRDRSVPLAGNLVQKSASDQALSCRSKEKVELSCTGFDKISSLSFSLSLTPPCLSVRPVEPD